MRSLQKKTVSRSRDFVAVDLVRRYGMAQKAGFGTEGPGNARDPKINEM